MSKVGGSILRHQPHFLSLPESNLKDGSTGLVESARLDKWIWQGLAGGPEGAGAGCAGKWEGRALLRALLFPLRPQPARHCWRCELAGWGHGKQPVIRAVFLGLASSPSFPLHGPPAPAWPRVLGLFVSREHPNPCVLPMGDAPAAPAQKRICMHGGGEPSGPVYS